MTTSEIEPATCFELTRKWGRLWIATFIEGQRGTANTHLPAMFFNQRRVQATHGMVYRYSYAALQAKTTPLRVFSGSLKVKNGDDTPRGTCWSWISEVRRLLHGQGWPNVVTLCEDEQETETQSWLCRKVTKWSIQRLHWRVYTCNILWILVDSCSIFQYLQYIMYAQCTQFLRPAVLLLWPDRGGRLQKSAPSLVSIWYNLIL